MCKWDCANFFLLVLASISAHNWNASATIQYTRGQGHHASPLLMLCSQSGSCADQEQSFLVEISMRQPNLGRTGRVASVGTHYMFNQVTWELQSRNKRIRFCDGFMQWGFLSPSMLTLRTAPVKEKKKTCQKPADVPLPDWCRLVWPQWAAVGEVPAEWRLTLGWDKERKFWRETL